MTKSNIRTERRTERLCQLMFDHQVNSVQVGRILGRSAQTVRSWRCNYDRTIPSQLLRLLEHELASGNKGGSKRSVEADE